jgi:hypothetical protein
MTLGFILLRRRTLELSGNAEAEANACRLLAFVPALNHSNGLELFLPQMKFS